MIKRTVAIILSVVFLLCALSSCGGAGSTTTTTPEYVSQPIEPMGDADGNGKTNEKDHALLLDYFAGSATEIRYEFCDLNGDFAVNEADAALLRSYLDGERVEIVGAPFAREDADVTGELVDLKINNSDIWSDKSSAYSISRNPYDMISSNGVVMVSGGNYNDNTGPVVIKGYVRGSDKPINMGSLNTEQVNRFYDCGNYIVALAIDAKTWGYGDVYMKSSTSNEWTTQSKVLVENIHCYDMVEFEGEYFFCGSSIKDIAGVGEVSKVSIYRSSSLVCAMSRYDFEELEVVNKHGEVLTYESSIASAEYNGENYYYSLGVPRFYEFFAFDGELYAFYYNQYSSRYDEKYDYNGLYRYDRESGRFIYDEKIDDEAIIKLLADTPQDREKIQHDFAFGDKYYFIKSGLYSTDDFNSIEKVVIEGYEDFAVRDAIFRGGKAYLLASRTKSNFFENVVLETADFVSFRPILHFDSDLFARSFEFCNGEFYFGLGISSEDDFDYYDITECGRIYRYRYYD